MAVDNGISPFSTAGIAAVNSIAPGGFTDTASFPPGTNVSSDPNQTIDNSIASTAGYNYFSYLSTIPKYYMTLGISQYSRTSATTVSSTTNVQGTIIMPLPSKIMDQHGVSYSETELGSLVGYLAGQAQKGWNEYKNTGDLLAAAGTTKDEVLKTKGDAFESLGIATLGGGSLGNAFSSVTGYSPNQFLTVLLKGPSYKKHNFHWLLSPRNAQESQNLNNIINLLNNSMAPAMSTNALWFSFPKIFSIAFMPNSQYLMKFKPAVLTDFIVDYTAGGGPSFYRSGNDGLNAPTVVDLRMVFHELEFWTAGNFSLNNNPTDVENTSQNFTDQFGTSINNALDSLGGGTSTPGGPGSSSGPSGGD